MHMNDGGVQGQANSTVTDRNGRVIQLMEKYHLVMLNKSESCEGKWARMKGQEISVTGEDLETGVGAKAGSGQVPRSPRWHTHKLTNDNSQEAPPTTGPGREDKEKEATKEIQK